MKKYNILKTAIILLIYRVLLDIVMATMIKDKYAYTYGTSNFNMVRFITTTIIILLLSKSMNKLMQNYKISNALVLILLIIYYIPSWVIFTWYDVKISYAIAILIHSTILILLNNIIPQIKINIKKNKWSDFQFNIIVWLILLISIIITGYYNGFKLHFRLDDVYELRAEQMEASLPIIVRYIQSIGGTIIPFIMAYYLNRKKYIMTGICTLTQLLIFSFGGQKTYFFYIICVYGIYLITKLKKDNNISWFLSGLTTITGVSVLEYLIMKTCYLSNYIIRRVMIVPARLSQYFFDFFTKNSPDYWHQSILRWIGLKSNYTQNISYMIGELYLKDEKIMANNGMIGDAFANFGWMGVIILPVLLIISFKILDGCAKGISPKETAILAVIYGINFTNGSFWTRMLTSGFLFIYIIVLLLPRENIDKGNNIYANIKKNY